MAASRDSFLSRLESGKSWSLIYKNKDRQGLVEVWRHGGWFIVTWEECPHGQQYDEAEYTRDERYQFDSGEELMAFLEANNLDLKSFKP